MQISPTKKDTHVWGPTSYNHALARCILLSRESHITSVCSRHCIPSRKVNSQAWCKITGHIGVNSMLSDTCIPDPKSPEQPTPPKTLSHPHPNPTQAVYLRVTILAHPSDDTASELLYLGFEDKIKTLPENICHLVTDNLRNIVSLYNILYKSNNHTKS